MISRRLVNALRIGLIVFLVFSLIFAIFYFSNNVVASSTGRTKYYTSILIKDGDTLWDIANEHHVEGTTTKNYMNDLCSINGISNSDAIKGGDYVTIYYYK